jgi:tRNA threonylcarbamoyladenosine biosynthesis protein TsaB
VIVLALESATELAGVALADDDGVIATATLGRGRRHAETMAPAIAWVCTHSGLALADVDVVAVDVGPGLFTGLRVGVATAKALAFALGRPAVGVTSLEVLAQAAAPSEDSALVVPVVDARRAEVFAARLRGSRGALTWEESPVRRTPAALAAELAALDEPFVLTGNGAQRYRAELAGSSHAHWSAEDQAFPQPDVLASVALAAARAGDAVDAATLAPRYLRDADTRINWERRQRVAGGVGP